MSLYRTAVRTDDAIKVDAVHLVARYDTEKFFKKVHDLSPSVSDGGPPPVAFHLFLS